LRVSVIVSCEAGHAGSGRPRGNETPVPGARVRGALLTDPPAPDALIAEALVPGALSLAAQAVTPSTATTAAAMAIADGRFRMAFPSRQCRGGELPAAALCDL